MTNTTRRALSFRFPSQRTSHSPRLICRHSSVSCQLLLTCCWKCPAPPSYLPWRFPSPLIDALAEACSACLNALVTSSSPIDVLIVVRRPVGKFAGTPFGRSWRGRTRKMRSLNENFRTPVPHQSEGFVFRGHEPGTSNPPSPAILSKAPILYGPACLGPEPRVLPELFGVVRGARRFEHFRVVLSLRRRFFLELIFLTGDSGCGTRTELSKAERPWRSARRPEDTTRTQTSVFGIRNLRKPRELSQPNQLDMVGERGFEPPTPWSRSKEFSL